MSASSTTADPAGARAHARGMAGTRVEAMPTVPATAATDLPPGVTPDSVVWDETIAAGGYAARILTRGTRLQLTDLHGDAAVEMLVFNAERTVERLNVADTVKVQWNAYLGAGRLLLSDMGRVMLSVIADDTKGHDAFCGASNQASNARKYGDGFNHGAHPNARDRFVIALAKYGMNRRDIHPCINWFKPVAIAADGAIELDSGPHRAGQAITLRAEMDVIVVLANCPHVRDPRQDYAVTAVRATAWRGPITAQDDPIRLQTPEGLRAFENVEDYYRR
jgi:urea carboxylase-associated protein 2